MIDSATVAENLRIGRFDTSFPWRIRWRRERREVAELLARFNIKVDANAPISSLREVERALVAILRALDDLRATGAGGVLILDEPTSYLPRDGVDQLFAAVREAANTGVGVLLVTHNLKEVRSVADRVSVLRNGQLVYSGSVEAVTEDEWSDISWGSRLMRCTPAGTLRNGAT